MVGPSQLLSEREREREGLGKRMGVGMRERGGGEDGSGYERENELLILYWGRENNEKLKPGRERIRIILGDIVWEAGERRKREEWV